MLRFDGAGISDVGLVRDHNEDAGFFSPYLALVADGVGGAAAGEIASATAAYAVAATVLAQSADADPGQTLAQGALAAQQQLFEGVRRDRSREGMATTLTALLTDGNRLVLGHVGDSRCYRWRRGSLSRVSVDHTYVQSLVDTGRLAATAAPTHPWRNVVLRSLDGSPPGREAGIDLVELEVSLGDRYLVCSDGVSDLVTETRMGEILADIADPLSAAARLVADARLAGGTDNITAVVLDLIDGPRVVADGSCFGALADVGNIVDAAAVRAVTG